MNMLTRRTFIKNTFALLSGIGATQLSAAAAPRTFFMGEAMFDQILKKSPAWKSLAMGDLMGKIAKQLEGTPYKPGTLDVSVDREVCTVNLTGLDCVTFFESTLDLARMLKTGGDTPEALLKQVEFTRYRGGVLGDYTSRLHYTSDWLYDNQQKGTIKMLDDLPGATKYSPNVSFMSDHPNSYPQLVAHPTLVEKIRKQESIINSRSMKYIPLDKIQDAAPFLKTGDIVGVCTSTPGLDITHTGIIYCDEKGAPHFMHASSSKSIYKVMIKPDPLQEALSWAKTNTGAIFARPLEPK